MSITLDLVGKRYGRLTVIKKIGGVNGRVHWECVCDCGNTVNVASGNLNSGHSKSCGCLAAELSSKRRKKDLTGQKFGRLTVIKDTGKKANGLHLIWLCKCECGKQTEVVAQSLLRGYTTSCGCVFDEYIKEKKLKLEGKRFGKLTVIKEVPNPKRNKTLWECVCDCGNTLITEGDPLTRGLTISCGCFTREYHSIRHMEFMEDNLKEGTCLFSLSNKPRKDSSTGVRGVYPYKGNRFRAFIVLKGQSKYLGTYDSLEDAAMARKKAEDELYNPILEKYGRSTLS